MIAFIIFLLIILGVGLAFGKKAAGKTILITIALAVVAFVGLIIWVMTAYPSNPPVQSTNESLANQPNAQLNVPIVQSPDETQSNAPPAGNATNDQQCQTSFGSYSVWSGQNNSQGGLICDCTSGYTWNSTQTECIAETDSQICQTQYGQMSIWTGQFNANDGPVCGCPSGYALSSDGTACVTARTPYDQTCQNTYGANSIWDGQEGANGGPICACQTGYVWNFNNTACVAQ